MFGSLIVFCCWFSADPDQPTDAKPDSASQVNGILERWQSATAGLSERSAAARESLRLKIANKLNGHAAVVVDQFAGRVQAKQLTEQFTWTQISSDEDQVCLEARPSDETEQLFLQSIRVWLNAKSFRLTRLEAMDRQGESRADWKAEPEIVVVAQTNEIGNTTPQTAVGINDANSNSQSRIKLVSARSAGDGQDSFPKEATPEIAEILDKWEAESRKIETAQIHFTRTVYNQVFEVEKVADGTLFYTTPDKIKITVKPGIQKGAASLRIGKSGSPFRIESDRAETWIYTDKQVLLINDEEKAFQRLETGTLPTEGWGLKMFLAFASPKPYELPFSLNIRAEQLKKDWQFKIVKKSPNRVVMAMTPRSERIHAMCSECWIIMETDSWQVSAAKYFDPSGNSETVYKINSRILNQKLSEDAFNPDLRALGYRETGKVVR